VYGPYFASAVAIADMTGDGLEDVVMSTGNPDDPATDNRVFIFPQESDGWLGPAAGFRYYEDDTLDVPGCHGTTLCATTTTGLALVDLDENGTPDVVVGHHFGVTVFENPGAGDLLPGVIVPRPSPYHRDHALRIQDIDFDGHVDVLSSCRLSCDDYIVVYRGDGTGAVMPDLIPIDRPARRFELADLTGDGISDIATTRLGLDVFAHDGIDTFQFTPTNVAADLETVYSFVVADVSGDGVADITATTTTSPGLWRLLGDGMGGFGEAEPVTDMGIPPPEEVRVADLNRDGRNDILVVHGGWQAVTVYLQDESGQFPSVDTYWIPPASFYDPQGVAIGDFYADGCPDVAIADYNSGLVVMYGVCEDYDCDGTIDELDFRFVKPRPSLDPPAVKPVAATD
jgi:hypothetical protein